MADDYVFLDHTLHAKFTDLWSPRNVASGWYRPWSREFYFWSIERLAGPSETTFHVVGLLLWISGLLLYAALLDRVTTSRTTLLACLGAATLAFWGTPLLWISGSQDLWMIVFAMGSMLLFVSHKQIA